MCGRFLLATPIHEIVELFGISGGLETGGETSKNTSWRARYNIAPTQEAPVVRQEGPRRTIALLRWGLVPAWVDDPAIGNRMINARCESVETKPAFRQAFQSQRCIIPADGFYEWKKLGSRKQPMAIRPRDRRPLAMAGLWERWEPRAEQSGGAGADPGQQALETFTVLTCDANNLLRDVHDRMPVLLEHADVDRWLTESDPAMLKALLKPYPNERLDMYPVSRHVNKPEHDDAQCIEEVREAMGDEQPGLFG